MLAFRCYENSDITLVQTALDTYKAALIRSYQFAKTNILAIDTVTATADGDVQAIADYHVIWPVP